MGKDKLFINGKIFTANKNMPFADTILVENGTIKWIGNKDNFTTDGNAYDIVDMKGHRVLPGLIDAHMHPIQLANTTKQIACLPPETNSIEDLIKHIKKRREKQGTGKWIEGWGYDEGKLKENRSPNRYDLDKAVTDSPVALTRTCLHIMAVNSKALELAGINRNTPDPIGGQIDRDENGEPTGILRENAKELVTKIMPSNTIKDNASNVADLGKLLLSHGITAVADCTGYLEKFDSMDIYNIAREKGFKQRVVIYYMWKELKNNTHFDMEKLNKNNLTYFGGIKIIGDGSVSGKTAWVDPPYIGDEKECGLPTTTKEELLDVAAFANKYKLQLAIHAMGERTIDLVVNTFYKKPNWLDNMPSVRIEHAAMPTENAIKRAAEAGIAIVTQPIFQYCEIESYLKNLGLERTKTTYPVKSFLNAGIKLAFSSDSPATSWADPSNPFVGIKAATTRMSYNGIDCGQEQRIDIPTAILLYTRESQRIVGIPNIGQLVQGYNADFIVLDKDILDVPPEKIDEINVLETYMGGELVYKK